MQPPPESPGAGFGLAESSQSAVQNGGGAAWLFDLEGPFPRTCRYRPSERNLCILHGYLHVPVGVHPIRLQVCSSHAAKSQLECQMPFGWQMSSRMGDPPGRRGPQKVKWTCPKPHSGYQKGNHPSPAVTLALAAESALGIPTTPQKSIGPNQIAITLCSCHRPALSPITPTPAAIGVPRPITPAGLIACSGWSRRTTPSPPSHRRREVGSITDARVT